MFKTTDLTLELLVGGVLILTSVVILVFSVVAPPNWLGLLAQIRSDYNVADISDKMSVLFLAVSLPLATAISYAIGLVAETVAREALEYWWHNAVKRKSLEEYFKAHFDVLSRSPILKKYASRIAPEKEVGRRADVLIGEMRFYVMMKDERLYREIELHLNQLRIMRVLLFALLFSSKTLEVSFLVVNGLLSLATARAIHSRFHRYCRAVERSYQALMIDEIKIEEKQKNQDRKSWIQSLLT